MLITEWQALFLKSSQSKQHNVYPTAMVAALLTPEPNLAIFLTKAYKYFARYESLVVSSTQINLDADPLSPRSLWKMLEGLEEVAAVVLTEDGATVTTEDGEAIRTESFIS